MKKHPGYHPPPADNYSAREGRGEHHTRLTIPNPMMARPACHQTDSIRNHSNNE